MEGKTAAIECMEGDAGENVYEVERFVGAVRSDEISVRCSTLGQ